MDLTQTSLFSGISQAEMAERLGMSRTAYRNLESGDTRLISENVDRIAAVPTDANDRPKKEQKIKSVRFAD